MPLNCSLSKVSPRVLLQGTFILFFLAFAITAITSHMCRNMYYLTILHTSISRDAIELASSIIFCHYTMFPVLGGVLWKLSQVSVMKLIFKVGSLCRMVRQFSYQLKNLVILTACAHYWHICTYFLK